VINNFCIQLYEHHPSAGFVQCLHDLRLVWQGAFMKEQTPTDESEDRGACAPVELAASGGRGLLNALFADWVLPGIFLEPARCNLGIAGR
jgi:hypothetical protein